MYRKIGVSFSFFLLFLSFLIFFIFLSLFLRFLFLIRLPPIESRTYDLHADGLVVLPQLISARECAQIKQWMRNNENRKAKEYITRSSLLKERIQSILGKEYRFHDYIFLIKKSQFHTCHRDYNGDFYNPAQKYPSYTIIIYIDDMEKCLDIIPGSHADRSNYMNLTDYTETVPCHSCDAILFNANLIHSGTIRENADYFRIQMKISHKEDMKTLDFYSDYNKQLTAENSSSMPFQYLQKHVSCQFPFMSDVLKQYDRNQNNSQFVTDGITNLISAGFAKLEDA